MLSLIPGTPATLGLDFDVIVDALLTMGGAEVDASPITVDRRLAPL
jgi:hypothetical protein